MTRPTDWWVLDLDGDPTPGSPSAVRTMARRWEGVAEDAEWAQRRMTQLMGDEAVGRWIGEAGDAFRSRTGELPQQLGRCAASYGEAASALSWWADRLEEHQHAADRALAHGRVARHELERAEAAASRAAEHTLSLAVPAFAGTAPAITPARVHDARARLASARAAQRQADAAVADAQARLDAARRLASDALALRESDGRAAAARIREAADAAIPERSRWEKIEDWATEAWHVVVEVAKVVVAALGIVALILGGPLAWVVFAAGVVLLADAVTRYVQGKASLWDVGLAALGCIPGARGLVSAQAIRSMAVTLSFTMSGVLRATKVVGLGHGVEQVQMLRTWTSPDPLVGELATAFERVLPGRIRGVNVHIPMLNGDTREVDLDLGRIVVQVKSGHARGLFGQMDQTTLTTDRLVVGYAPDMKYGALCHAARSGRVMVTGLNDLVSVVKELL